MKTEIDLARDLSSAGWVGEIEKYNFTTQPLQELLTIYGLSNDSQSSRFSIALNRSIAGFCYKVECYHARTKLDGKGEGKVNPKKITTELQKLCDDFSKQSQKLLSITNKFKTQEIEWLFADYFEGGFLEANKSFDNMVMLLSWFQRFTETTDIKVTSSTISFVRDLTRECINIVEHFTGTVIVSESDPVTGKNESTFSSFMVTLWEHIPNDIKEKLAQQPGSFESVIRAAIAENKRLMAAEGL